jgi:acyl-CoA-dependent ceramide synthase
MFGLFTISWIVARHILYLAVWWSIYADTPKILPVGCFKGANSNLVGPVDAPPGLTYLIDPFINSSGLVCYDETIKWAFLMPLLLLQALTIFWFMMILRVLVTIIKAGTAEDTRSDSEASKDD